MSQRIILFCIAVLILLILVFAHFYSAPDLPTVFGTLLDVVDVLAVIAILVATVFAASGSLAYKNRGREKEKETQNLDSVVSRDTDGSSKDQTSDDGEVEESDKEVIRPYFGPLARFAPTRFAPFGETRPLPSSETFKKLELEFEEIHTHVDRFQKLEIRRDQYWVQRIFFGTNRASSSLTGWNPQFGFDQSDILHVGHTYISIPKNSHRIGRVEIPRKLEIATINLWSEQEDPRKHFTTLFKREMDVSEFKKEAKAVAVGAINYKNSAFLFIHGFNTNFEQAMFRAAQLAHDLNFDGPAFAFSWPSKGTVDHYLADVEAARGAADRLDEFFDIIVSTPGITKLHVVAHSMGNEALAELMTRAGSRLDKRKTVAIDQLILAAPDVDAERFKGIAQHFVRQARGITLYACATDLALMASEKLRRGNPRAGDVPENGPVVVDGIDTIDVTAVGTELFSLNHNVYARNRGLLDDVGNIFLDALRPPPRRMPTLREGGGEQGLWWIMPE